MGASGLRKKMTNLAYYILGFATPLVIQWLLGQFYYYFDDQDCVDFKCEHKEHLT